jgi:hypothetical protein
MKFQPVFWLALICGPASATKTAEVALKEVVAGASEIAIARIESMAGRTGRGVLITKGYFRTGPGSGNTFVATLRILQVLKGGKLWPGMQQQVDLWPGWHMDGMLDDPIDHPTVIVFLKQSGAGLVAVNPPDPYLLARHVEKDVRALLRQQQSALPKR